VVALLGLVSRRRAEQHGAMAFDVERLLRLWTELPADDVAAEAAFRQLYADPVSVNGAPVSVRVLVARARALGAVFDGLQRELLDVVDDGGKVAVAFRLRGRHVGTLGTAAGPVPATGRPLEIRVIDVLTLTDGRISSIWMVADELGALLALDAVRLSSADGATAPAG
jgi:ketosteroid isomerase-like protein